jgi:hypothetical protein
VGWKRDYSDPSSFCDEVLLFVFGYIREIQIVKDILILYSIATGMKVNLGKLVIYPLGMDANIRNSISRFFSFQRMNFEDGLKYLGFILKHNNYKKEDWRWFLSRIE